MPRPPAALLLLAGAAKGLPQLQDGAMLLQFSFEESLAVQEYLRHEHEPEALPMMDVGYVEEPTPIPKADLKALVPADLGMVEYKMRDGLLFYGYNKTEDNFVSGSLAKGKLWEAKSSSEFCKYFKELGARADFLDVGANIGTWTVPIARCIRDLGYGGRALAVEGMPPIARHLEAAVAGNNLTDVVDVYNYVVGDGMGVDEGGEEPGEAGGVVHMSLDPTNKGGSSVVNRAENGTFVTSYMTTLDSIIGNYEDLAVFGMKVDIEGYEGRALKGALALLERPPCVLNIELNRQFLQRAGTPLEEVVQQLSEAGFDMPAYDKWPSLSSQMYFQRDFQACRQRFGGVALAEAAANATANATATPEAAEVAENATEEAAASAAAL